MITLSFLLIAALCLDAFSIQKIIYYPAQKKNWTEARRHCQKKYIDLVTLNVVDEWQLTGFLKDVEVQQIWIGLLRDPDKDSVWKWINIKSGEGISGEDLSQHSKWADGEQSPRCAVVSDNLMWHSERCSDKQHFYCSVQNNIQHHKNSLNWRDASLYCKENISDLATITITNTDKLQRAGWIGLYREAGETWKWIGDQPSDYRNWAPGQPLNADCGSFNRITKKWQSKVCSEEHEFVCYNDNLVVVNENKTWADALTHCRVMRTPCENMRPCRYYYELLSLDHFSGYNYIRDRIYRATTDEVWISLRFLGGTWWWMNGQRVDDNGKLPYCPSHWKHCGTLSKYSTNNWITRDCSERRNFICSRYAVWIV